MKIEVNTIVDNADGSCNADFEMDVGALLIFAKIGLLSVLEKSAVDLMTEQGLTIAMVEKEAKKWAKKPVKTPAQKKRKSK
jgi:hypothetical protein